MNWARSHWKAIAISTALFFVGIGLGASSSEEEGEPQAAPERITATQTLTVTEAETVVQTKTVRLQPAGPKGEIPGDGTFIVGDDVQPGTYKAAASEGCYWARLGDLNGTLDSILANTNTNGPAVIQVLPSDKAIETSNCATFRRVS